MRSSTRGFGKSISGGKLAKAQGSLAPQNDAHEQILCAAIAKRVLVKIKYDNDLAERLFQPTAVYFSTRDKVCVSGIQIANPAKPMDANEPRNFEVVKIRNIVLTEVPFSIPLEFDSSDNMYCNGVICPI